VVVPELLVPHHALGYDEDSIAWGVQCLSVNIGRSGTEGGSLQIGKLRGHKNNRMSAALVGVRKNSRLTLIVSWHPARQLEYSVVAMRLDAGAVVRLLLEADLHRVPDSGSE